MQNLLTIAGLQTELVWENSVENLKNFESKVASISPDVDLIVLPEMFSTGFTMQPKNVAETMSGISVLWMKDIAVKYDIALLGSLVIKENLCYYNRAVFVSSDGEISIYDKRHTFTLAGEGKIYTAGREVVIINYKGWKICPQICYDLRFPVWSRNVQNYDVLIYIANWPKTRITAWDTLLKARAIENMSYCFGINRVGVDKNNYKFSGHSSGFDFLGNQIASTKENEEDIFITSIDKQRMISTRDKLQFLNDKDNFTILP